eukprot:g2837.t1
MITLSVIQVIQNSERLHASFFNGFVFLIAEYEIGSIDFAQAEFILNQITASQVGSSVRRARSDRSTAALPNLVYTPRTSGASNVQSYINLFEKDEFKESLKTLSAWLCDPNDVVFDEQDVIGKGRFGMVYKCKYNDRKCAMKVLRTKTSTAIEKLLAEALQMQYLQHPNLLQMIACHFTIDAQFLITEFAELSTLQECILSDRMNLTLNNHLLEMLIGVAKSMQFIHSRQKPIIHRDIKPDNILVRANYTSLLADFGECKVVNDEDHNATSEVVGTPFYIAPEIFKEESGSLSQKADVFSFGMVMLVVSTFYH